MRNMENASSAHDGASRRSFDTVLEPDKADSESQLVLTRDPAMSDRRQESFESINTIRKVANVSTKAHEEWHTNFLANVIFRASV